MSADNSDAAEEAPQALRDRFFSIVGSEDGRTDMQAEMADVEVEASAGGLDGQGIARTASEVAGMDRDLSDLLQRRIPESSLGPESATLASKADVTDAICALLYRILKSEQPMPVADETAVVDDLGQHKSCAEEVPEKDTNRKLAELTDLLRLLCKYDDIPAATRVGRVADVADGICAVLSQWVYEEGGFGVFSEHFDIVASRDSGEGNNAVIKFAVLRPRLPALSWAVFVVFRGTLTKEDWLRDISCWPVTEEVSGIRLHQGMLAAAQDCYHSWSSRGLVGVHQALCELPPVPGGQVTVYLTGHSLGGAIAHAVQLLTRTRPIRNAHNAAFSFCVTTFGSPLVFQAAEESPDHYAREEVEGELAALHANARNYVSCHDLVPRILCTRGEELERLKRILVEAGKEHAKSSAWAIWMVVEGRAEQAISGLIEGIMNILRSVSRQGKYILVGQLLQVCSAKACFLKDPAADLYRFRMDSPWTHIEPGELVEAAFTPPEWLEQIPEGTNIKRAVKAHSMAGYVEALVGERPPWLHEIISLDNLSHEPARLSDEDNVLTDFFRLTPAVVRNLRSMELIAAAAQASPGYDFDDTCYAVLVETAMNVNTVRRHLRHDSASADVEQLKDVAKKILEMERRNSSELLAALTAEQKEVLDRNRRIGMQVVNSIEAAKKSNNPGAVIMAMSSRRSNPGVLAKGAYALVSLAEGNKARMKELLEREGPGSDGGSEAVAEWLAAVRTIIETQQSRVGSGAVREVVGLVVESMRDCTQHARALEQGTAVLASIAHNAEYHPRLATENCISLLILAMAQHRAHPGVQEQAVLALSRLASNEELPLKARIGCEGGISALVEAMKAHAEVATLQEQGLLTLCKMSDDAECAEAMQRETSGVRDVVAGAFRHVGSARVQEHGGELNGRLGLALSPAELASSAIEASRVRSDAEAILRAMKEQTYQVHVQRHGFKALSEIMLSCGAGEERKEAADSAYAGRAIVAIIDGMRQHADNSAAQIDGSDALSQLSQRRELCVKIGEEGGIAALVEAMKVHPAVAHLQEQACVALKDLCSECIENEALKDDLGGNEVAVEAMRRHGNNRGVVQKASLVIGWGEGGDGTQTPLAGDGTQTPLLASEPDLDAAVPPLEPGSAESEVLPSNAGD